MLQHSKGHGDGPCDHPGSAGACVVVLGVDLLKDVGHASHSMQGLHLLLNLVLPVHLHVLQDDWDDLPIVP